MSMRCYETRGYGIEFGARNGTNTTADKIRAMLELAPDLKKSVNDWLIDCDIAPNEAEVDDYADFDQDYYNGIPALLAQAINEYYGHLIMDAASDENGVLYLFLPCGLPWENDEYVQGLTQEEVDEMLRKFYNMLYEDEVSISDVSICNFG